MRYGDDNWLAELKLGERRLVVRQVSTSVRAPVFRLSAGAGGRVQTPLSYGTISSCGFEPKRRDGRNRGSLSPGSDANDSIWFVAFAIEQLALITDNGSHKFLSLRVKMKHHPAAPWLPLSLAAWR
jgi:hypothetical protein